MKVDQPETVDATVFLQVEPEWKDNWYEDRYGDRVLNGAKVVRLTQKRPDRPMPGTVISKITLRLPASAFLPLQPEAVVVVPESMTEPVLVEAEDPHEEASDG